MGANSPASVPSLLLGCLDAYSMAVASKGSHAPIVKAAKLGVQALANLSESERARVLNKLQSTNTMLDLQLKFAMEKQDCTTACCFLLQHLSKELMVASTESPKTIASATGKRNQVQQAAGDRSSDHRIEDTALTAKVSESLVPALLADGQNLYRAVLSFLSGELVNMANMEPKAISIGKLSLLLKACCWTLLVPLNAVGSKLQDTLDVMQERVLPNTRQLEKKLSDYWMSLGQKESNDLPKSSSFDRVMKMFFSTTVLAITRLLSLRQVMISSQGGTASPNTFESLTMAMDELKESKPISEQTQVFTTKVKNGIVEGNVSVVISLLLSDWNGIASRGLEKLDHLIPTLEHGLKELSDLWKTATTRVEPETMLDLGSRAALLILKMKNEANTSESSVVKLSTIENVQPLL